MNFNGFIIIICISIISVVLAGISRSNYREAQKNDPSNYSCTVEQMQLVEHETKFCNEQGGYFTGVCYKMAIKRNCTFNSGEKNVIH